jgi:hypothetical protein
MNLQMTLAERVAGSASEVKGCQTAAQRRVFGSATAIFWAI